MNTDVKNALGKIYDNLKQLFEVAEPVQVVAATPYVLADGTPIEVEALEVGKVVLVGGQPAPEGSHTLADGQVIVTDAEGVITAINPAVEPVVEEPVAMESEEVALLKAQIAELMAKLAVLEAKEVELGDYKKKQEEKMNALFEAVKILADQPVAAPAQAAPNNFESAKPNFVTILKTK